MNPYLRNADRDALHPLQILLSEPDYWEIFRLLPRKGDTPGFIALLFSAILPEIRDLKLKENDPNNIKLLREFLRRRFPRTTVERADGAGGNAAHRKDDGRPASDDIKDHPRTSG